MEDLSMSDLSDFVNERIDQDLKTLKEAREKELKRLAAQYSDHPDYRPEWAPDVATPPQHP
jgi:hypothetical protein